MSVGVLFGRVREGDLIWESEREREGGERE